ncbi:MAG: SpoIIE family protein phosphatase [Bacteroidales bacterium]|nr:SpoIIE family protein phosphatase [Bacteroidales bacterium]
MKKLIEKSSIIKNWVFLIVIIAAIVLLYMLYRLSGDIEQLSKKSLNVAIETTIKELNSYISPFVKNLKLSQEWGSLGQFNLSDVKSLNERFIPILRTYNQITSMLIGRSDGSEYMLLNEDTSWLNRKTIVIPQKEVRKIRWRLEQKNLVKVLDEIWYERMNYDPRVRPWYKAAINLSNTSNPAWTKPYIFATTKDPGITASIPFRVEGDTSQWVLAYDLKIFDVALFTSRLRVSENGKLIILTEDSLLIGLPNVKRFITSSSIKSTILKPIDSLKIGEISYGFRMWNSLNKTDKPFSFTYNNETWWSRFVMYPLNENNKFIIAVVVPESDFVADVKRTRNIILFGFLLVLTLIIVIVISYKQKQKTNLILKAQKQQIEQQRDYILLQKKEIEDSIHYAQKIQTAILPNTEFVNKVIPNNFVLYMPKDVVSGDFYWVNEINNWKIAVVADCTGHGVPGGFMSMLGISFLNEIVVKKEITQPAYILDNMRKNVIEALKQTNISSSQKDGMDVSLMALNFLENIYLWAGANNPLWIVRKEKIEKIDSFDDKADIIEEIKPNSMPVAIYENMVPFTQHTIQLNEGDRLFMFSDGFADQFGGPKGKKYLSKNFKRLIAETSIMSLEQQKIAIQQNIIHWMNAYENHYEQTDDITVMAIEI